MKQLILSLLLMGALAAKAQQPYAVYTEQPGEKTYKGFITREILQADSSFTWYKSNLQGYTPQAAAVEALKRQKDSIHILAFMGTWCGDSHFIIPKFFALADAAGFSNDRITLLGVDRAKKTYSHLTDALNVTNVPTLIVYKNGKELGRVVEYGKYGMFDKELGEIIVSGEKR